MLGKDGPETGNDILQLTLPALRWGDGITSRTKLTPRKYSIEAAGRCTIGAAAGREGAAFMGLVCNCPHSVAAPEATGEPQEPLISGADTVSQDTIW
jgi:hypothetical protein